MKKKKITGAFWDTNTKTYVISQYWKNKPSKPKK